MPPKKKEEVKKKVILGRPGNTLKMGIVGLPNVGKSSTFNLMSKLSVPAENYPFCTIEPNRAQVPIPDERFNKLCSMWKPKSEVAATLSIIDIAGLVRGASEGQGLGNAFLSHIQGVDGIFHVLRAFDNEEIIHHEGDVDPIRDLEIIHSELALKDLQILEGKLADLDNKIKRFNDKNSKEEKAVLDKVFELLKANKWVTAGEWNDAEIEILNRHLFLTSKPVVYLVNLTKNDFLRKKNKWLPKIQEWVQNNNQGPIIPYSVDYETEIFGQEETKNNEEEKKEGEAQPSMLPKIIKVGYKTLNLIHFFTAGVDEVRCWTVQDGAKAPQAAGTIHTDFEKGFICAEVMKYEDFVRLGTETAVKAEGKYRQQGKEYLVEDGDIMFFKFNPPKSSKK